MYTGLNRSLFGILLLGWFCPAIHMHLESVSPVNLPVPCTGDFFSDSQKLLLVLMHLRQKLTQEDWAFRFVIQQSTASRVTNQWIPLLARYLALRPHKMAKRTIGPTVARYNCLMLANSIGSWHHQDSTKGYISLR